MSNLIELDPDTIMRNWKPDRHPTSAPWTWEQAAGHFFAQDTARTLSVLWAMQTRGPHFADETAPILLGADGYVHDGHHRIIVAHALMVPALHAEVPR